MIKSFRDKDTAKVFSGARTKKVPADVLKRAARKLEALDQAESVKDLEVPPGNRLEQLHGDREGQFSIRVNRQWRICFEFDEESGDAYAAELSKHYEG